MGEGPRQGAFFSRILLWASGVHPRSLGGCVELDSEAGSWGIYPAYSSPHGIFQSPAGGQLLTHTPLSSRMKSSTPLSCLCANQPPLVLGITLRLRSCQVQCDGEALSGPRTKDDHTGTIGAWSGASPVSPPADICWVIFPHAGMRVKLIPLLSL